MACWFRKTSPRGIGRVELMCFYAISNQCGLCLIGYIVPCEYRRKRCTPCVSDENIGYADVYLNFIKCLFHSFFWSCGRGYPLMMLCCWWVCVFGYDMELTMNCLTVMRILCQQVLLETINIVTFFFLIYPSILIVWGVLILSNAWQYMAGVISLEVIPFISSSWYGPYSFSSSSSQSM